MRRIIQESSAWLSAVATAARAPSPHNAQPARWQLNGAQVYLLGDSAGWLAQGDPTGRDDSVALGMGWEAMVLALSTIGLHLATPHMAPGAGDRARPGLRLVASAELTEGARHEPIAGFQEQRRSFRGCFAPASAAQQLELDACIHAHAADVMPIPESVRPSLARWYDCAAAAGLRETAVARELYRFMRFSRSDPRWLRDGLAADCMMMDPFEAWGASWLMRPPVLAVLGKLGWLEAVLSESKKVMSAARVVAIHAAIDESAFDAGRHWYRFWLSLTAAGFSAVPMSALADSQLYSAELLSTQPLPAGRRLLNVMRIGPSPVTPAPRSARLPAEELIATTA